jgi:hypothetical protein
VKKLSVFIDIEKVPERQRKSLYKLTLHKVKAYFDTPGAQEAFEDWKQSEKGKAFLERIRKIEERKANEQR